MVYLEYKLMKGDRQKANGGAGEDDDLMDTLTAQERRRQARERELEADMAVAAELMGGMGNDDGEFCSPLSPCALGSPDMV